MFDLMDPDIIGITRKYSKYKIYWIKRNLHCDSKQKKKWSYTKWVQLLIIENESCKEFKLKVIMFL